MARIIAFVYGFGAYGLFLAVFLYLIGFLANQFVPKGIDDGMASPMAIALLVNLGLVALFGVQHSIMARPGFKQWLTRFVPQSVERSTFVLATSLVLALTYWQWRPMTAAIWHVETTWLATALWVAFATGFLIVLLSTLIIDHFDLFGLRQVTLNLLRRQYTHLIGGPHVSVYQQRVFEQAPDIDAAVQGEGEISVRLLVDALAAGKDFNAVPGLITRDFANPPAAYIEDLDTLPLPARHLLPNNTYTYLLSKGRVTTLFSSRGCPYQCIFCDKAVFGSRWRARSAENVLEELEQVVREFGVTSVVFYDDLFTVRKERVIEICQGILERRLGIEWKCEGRVNIIDRESLAWMKRAGCSMIAYGVESGNQKGLDYLNKGTTVGQIREAFELTRRAGIKPMGYFVLGIPVETFEEENHTIEFAKEIKAAYAQFSVLSPTPGTRLYDEAISMGWYREVGAPHRARSTWQNSNRRGDLPTSCSGR